MGQGTLVEMQMDGGQDLIKELQAKGFDVTVGGWTKTSEDGDWYLYIASKDVDRHGIVAAYGTIFTTIQANPKLGIDPFEVKLIEDTNPIARDLLDIRGSTSVRFPTRSHRPRLGHISVEETYVYAA